MISTERSTRGMYIKVLNYNTYQQLDNYSSTERSTKKAPEKHQRSTPIHKNVKNEKNVNKEAEASSAVFVWKEYLKKLDDSPKENIQLIGHFFRERNLTFDSVEQARIAIKRYLRVSMDITKFPKDKVFKAFDRVKSQHKDIDWSLETVLKKLTN